MYDTFIERPLTQSRRRGMQLSWHYIDMDMIIYRAENRSPNTGAEAETGASYTSAARTAYIGSASADYTRLILDMPTYPRHSAVDV